MTQQQYLALKQPSRHLHVKIDILNFSNAVISTVSGLAISGNINISADSPYRRNGNITLLSNPKHNLIPKPDSLIWFDKKVKIQIGIDNYKDETIWFNLGVYAVLDCNVNEESPVETTINLELADMMAFLDGTLGGSLVNKTKIYNKNTTVNQAIISILTGLVPYSIEKIMVSDIDEALLPYDIEAPVGMTSYSLVKELVDLHMGYEFFFNEDGYLVIQKIKDRKSDGYVWDFVEDDLSLTSQNKFNFQNVRNDVWVYGRTDQYNNQIVTNYHNRFSRNTISERDAIATKSKNDICYVKSEDKSYIWNGSAWVVLNFNVNPIFNSESIGYKPRTYEDGNVFTDVQAKLRCQYELENHSNFAETVSFNCVPIYALDVNKKIKVNKESVGIVGDYLIESVGFSLDIQSPMTLNCRKIYYADSII